MRDGFFRAGKGLSECSKTTVLCQRKLPRALSGLSPSNIWKSYKQHRCFREAKHRSASRRRVRQHTPALRLQPETRPPELPALASRPCPSRSALRLRVPPSVVNKLKGMRGPGGNHDIFPRPSDAIARQPRTRCTGSGLARRPRRLTPEVNSGCLRSSAGLLTSPGAPERCQQAERNEGARGKS